MTSVTMPRRVHVPAFGRLAPRDVLIGFGATFAGSLIVLGGLSMGLALASEDVVHPRVSVGAVAIGGLDRAEAEARLESALPSLSRGTATLVVRGTEAQVEYADLGRGYEMAAMLDVAFGVGRDDGIVADGIDRLRALFVGASLPVQVHAYDAAAMDRISAEIAERFSHPPVDALVTREGTDFAVSGASAGSRLDADLVRSTLAAVAATTDPADVRLEIAPAVVPPAVTTTAAEAVADMARATVADLTLTIPGAADDEAPLALTAETIAGWLSFGPDDGEAYAIHVGEAAATDAIAALVESVDRDRVNASFSLAGGGLGGVIPAADGRALDVDASVDALLTQLERRGSGASVPSLALAVDITEPALTTAEAEAAFPQMQMVSSWTTYYPPHNGSPYNPNIVIPATDIDGRVLAPGEWFSFWDSLGPITLERGYTYGGVIINGRSVADGALAGGICSTSTTIFNAALRFGLEMGDRLNHYYYIDRYPNGLDATVYTDGTWTQDMTFRNDTEHPIVIRGFGGGGFVRFDLWSVPSGRSVVITDPVTSNHRVAGDTTQVDSSMAPGTARRVEYPHNGHDVSRSRFVYDAEGNLLHENHYFSSYRTVNGVTLVGPTPAAPPVEDPPEEAAEAAGDGVLPPDEGEDPGEGDEAP
ncbi:MAG: VanW family protein [Candidatus Limnocylindria bacterium]